MTNPLARTTIDPAVMGGKPCLRGLRVAVDSVVGLVATGRQRDEILRAYPYLEPEDIKAALAYLAEQPKDNDVQVATLRYFMHQAELVSKTNIE